MKTLDTRGLKCPKPLIMLKEAMLEAGAGEELTILTDNDTSLKNLTTFLQDHGGVARVTSEDNVHHIITEVSAENLAGPEPGNYCREEPEKPPYVVCIRNNLMGEGDPDLGKVLMESFLENLKLQRSLPSHIILYNAGVRLAMKESPVCSALSELEEMGTRIVLCGTCIDHYGLQYEIGVGMISDMVTITQTLAAAGHVLYP